MSATECGDRRSKIAVTLKVHLNACGLCGGHDERTLCHTLSCPLHRSKEQRSGEPREAGHGSDIALAVARGLQWLHANDIVHQDLRPSKGETAC